MDSAPAFQVKLCANYLNCIGVPLNPTHYCSRYADLFVCSNVDVHALKREAEFYCITPLSEFTVLCHVSDVFAPYSLGQLQCQSEVVRTVVNVCFKS